MLSAVASPPGGRGLFCFCAGFVCSLGTASLHRLPHLGDTWLLWSGRRWECEFENVLMSLQIAHSVPHHLKAAGAPTMDLESLRHMITTVSCQLSHWLLIGFWLTASEPASITNSTNYFGENWVFFSFFCKNPILSLSTLWQLILLIEPSDHCQSAVYLRAIF